jgi:hypothetical protein
MSGLHIDEKIGVPFALIVSLMVAFLFMTPASFWLHVNRMDIQDAATWQDVTVDYDRTIRRDFTGEWRAMIRRQVEGGYEVVCASEWQPNDYQTDAVLPEPVTLEWLLWTAPYCYRLPPGAYEATVTWRINPGSWLFERETRRTDGFLIYGAS